MKLDPISMPVQNEFKVEFVKALEICVNICSFELLQKRTGTKEIIPVLTNGVT